MGQQTDINVIMIFGILAHFFSFIMLFHDLIKIWSLKLLESILDILFGRFEILDTLYWYG